MAENDKPHPPSNAFQSASTPYVPGPFVQLEIAAQHGIVLPHQRSQQRDTRSSAEVHSHSMRSSLSSGSSVGLNGQGEQRGGLAPMDSRSSSPRDPVQSSSHSQSQWQFQPQPQTWPQPHPQPPLHPQPNPYTPSRQQTPLERLYQVALSPEELSHRIALFLFPLFEARLGPLEIAQQACQRTLDDQKTTMNRFLATIQTQYHTIAMQNEYMRSGMKELWNIVDDLRKGKGRGEETTNCPWVNTDSAPISDAPLDNQQRNGPHAPSDRPGCLVSTAASIIPTSPAFAFASDSLFKSDANPPSSSLLSSSTNPRDTRTIPRSTNFDSFLSVRVDKGKSRLQDRPSPHENRNETELDVQYGQDHQSQNIGSDEYKRLITPDVRQWAEETFPQEAISSQLASEVPAQPQPRRHGRPPGKSNKKSQAILRLAIPPSAFPTPSVSNNVSGSPAVTSDTQTNLASNPTRRNSTDAPVPTQSSEPISNTSNLTTRETSTHNASKVDAHTFQLQVRREPPLGIFLGTNSKRPRPQATSFPTSQAYSQSLTVKERPRSRSGSGSSSDSDEPLDRKLKRRCVSEGRRLQEAAEASGSHSSSGFKLPRSNSSVAPASTSLSEMTRPQSPDQPTPVRDQPVASTSTTTSPAIATPALVISPRRPVYAQPPSPPWITEARQTLALTPPSTSLSASSSLASVSSSCSHLSIVSPTRPSSFHTDATNPGSSPAFKLRQVAPESTSPSPSPSPAISLPLHPPKGQADVDLGVSGPTTAMELAVSASMSIPTPSPSPAMQSLPAPTCDPTPADAKVSHLFQSSGSDGQEVELGSSLLMSKSRSSMEEGREGKEDTHIGMPPSNATQDNAVDARQESAPSATTARSDQGQETAAVLDGAMDLDTSAHERPEPPSPAGGMPSREIEINEEDSEPPSSQPWSILEELVQPTSSPSPEEQLNNSELTTPRLRQANLEVTHSPPEPEPQPRPIPYTPTSQVEASAPSTKPTPASTPKAHVSVPRVLVDDTSASYGIITPTPSVSSSEGNHEGEERSTRSMPTPITSTSDISTTIGKEGAEDATCHMKEGMEDAEEGEIAPSAQPQPGVEQDHQADQGEPEEGEIVASTSQDTTFDSLPPVPDSPLWISPLPLSLPLPSLQQCLSGRVQEEDGVAGSTGQSHAVVPEKEVVEGDVLGGDHGGDGETRIVTQSQSASVVISGGSRLTDGDQTRSGPSAMDTCAMDDAVDALTVGASEADASLVADTINEILARLEHQERPVDGSQPTKSPTGGKDSNSTNDQDDTTPSLGAFESILQSFQQSSAPATPGPVDLGDEDNGCQTTGYSAHPSAEPITQDTHEDQPDDIPATPRHMSPDPASPLSDLSALTPLGSEDVETLDVDNQPVSLSIPRQSPSRPPSRITLHPSQPLSRSGYESLSSGSAFIEGGRLHTSTIHHIALTRPADKPSISPTETIKEMKALREKRMKESGLDLDDDDDEDLIRPVKKKKKAPPTMNVNSSADPPVAGSSTNPGGQYNKILQGLKFRKNVDKQGMTGATTRIKKTKPKAPVYTDEGVGGSDRPLSATKKSAEQRDSGRTSIRNNSNSDYQMDDDGFPIPGPIPSSNRGNPQESLSQGGKEKKRKRRRSKSPGRGGGSRTRVSAKAERLSPGLPSFNSAASSDSRQSVRSFRRPRKVKVDWPPLGDPEDTFTRGFIACDSCHGWFHYGCIGITNDAHPLLQQDAAFLCPFCVDSSDMVNRGESEECKRPDCNQPNQSLEGDGLFVVAYILGRRPKAVGRTKLDQFSYLIKWEGYGVHECTWEGIDVFTGDPKPFIDEFQQSALAQDITLPDYDEDQSPLTQVILLQEAIDHGWMGRVEADSVWLNAFGRAF